MDSQKMTETEIARLLARMLSSRGGERLLFITDYPEGKLTPEKQARHALLLRWHSAAKKLVERAGIRLLPIAKYRETGRHNADLPKTAATEDGGHVDDLPALIANANIVIAMNEYSATAPLKNIASRAPSLRIVSMPGVNAAMEGAMSADYARIAERGKRLKAVVESAAGFEVTFDGAQVPRGTKLFIDTRSARFLVDDGTCIKPGEFINFPSGEVFAAPYEGVTAEGRASLGDSRTSGIWPVWSHMEGKVAFLKVEKNRIVRVQGDSEEATRIIDDIARDENAANVAEIGFGINEKARCGAGVPVLESEKAGPHIAYGRNDHFGAGTQAGGETKSHTGKVRASVHRDFVYAKESPITATIYAVFQNGRKLLIAERGKIVVV